MEYAIITGASRGLGKALAYELGGKGINLLLISRNKRREMQKDLKNNGISFKFLQFDLSNIYKLDNLMEEAFKNINLRKASRVILINNAGVISPISPVGKIIATGAILNNLYVNTVAPIVLSNIFIKKTQALKCKKIIINISSGAAEKSIEGWSLYCSSKAAVKIFSLCVKKEQARQKDGVQIFTFDPGVVNTNMQRQIRTASVKALPSVKYFIDLYKGNLLKPPSSAAKEIYKLFLRERKIYL